MNTIELYENSNYLIDKAKSIAKKVAWLSPLKDILTEPSSQFGRNIEREINQLTHQNEPMKLQLRKVDAAVVISIKQYEQMLELSEAFQKLLEQERKRSIIKAGLDFDSAYEKLTSSNNCNATNHLIDISDEDLAESYQPGRTETL